MPTYEYICSACGHEFEQFQSITAAPTKLCPVCKKRKVERKISVGAGFIFKGGGFYETDYRNEAYKKDAAADKSSGESDGKANDAKPAEGKAAEAKPADAKPAETSKSEVKSTTTRAGDGSSKASGPASSTSRVTGAAKPSKRGGRNKK